MFSYSPEESRYTTQVQLWHQQLAPAIPIESFVDYLDADLLGLENQAQFYAPIEFAVHVRGPISGPAGAVRLHVPVHANENWLPILERRIGQMYGAPSNARIELKTISGRSLSEFTPEELPNVGKLNVYIDGHRARMHELPEVPMEYSINKMDSIHAWYSAVKEDLPEMLAQEMMHKNASELNAAISPGGIIETMIKTHLKESTTDWNEFVRVNHMNSPSHLGEEGSEEVLNHIASNIRTNLRYFVQSSAEEISTYLQSVEAERVAQQLKAEGKDTDEYKPIFGNTNAPLEVKVSAEDGFEMFHGIMEALFDLPTIETEVVNAIYTKPIAACRWETEPARPKKRVPQGGGAPPPGGAPQGGGVPPSGGAPQGGGAPPPGGAPQGGSEGIIPPPLKVSPWANKQELVNEVGSSTGTSKRALAVLKKAGYDDNTAKAFVDQNKQTAGPRTVEELSKFFNLNSPLIQAHHPWNAQIHHTLKEVAGGVYPEYYTERHMKEDMTENAVFEGDLEKTYRAYHMFANAHPMPMGVPLNPIQSRIPERPALISIEKAQEMRSNLVRVKTGMPELVPIECHNKGRRKKRGEEEDMEAPIGRQMPELIPIECHNKERRKKRGEDMEAPIGREMPELIPIECHNQGRRKKRGEEDEEDMKSPIGRKLPTGHGFSGLPEVDDFF